MLSYTYHVSVKNIVAPNEVCQIKLQIQTNRLTCLPDQNPSHGKLCVVYAHMPYNVKDLSIGMGLDTLYTCIHSHNFLNSSINGWR
jgi:hypothetical protein